MGSLGISKAEAQKAKDTDVSQARDVYEDETSSNSNTQRQVGVFGSDLEQARRDMYYSAEERPLSDYGYAEESSFHASNVGNDYVDPERERKKLFGEEYQSLF